MTFGAGEGRHTCAICGADCTNSWSEPAPGLTVCRDHRLTATEVRMLMQGYTGFKVHGTTTGRFSGTDPGNGDYTATFTKRPNMPANENFSLLIKLLKMTTSSNDAEALLAARKANEQLRKLGWEWEKLLTQRVTIVEDPFNDAPVIPQRNSRQYTTADIDDAYDKGVIEGRKQAEYSAQRRASYNSPFAGSSAASSHRSSQTAPRRPKAPKAKSYSANGVTLKDLGL